MKKTLMTACLAACLLSPRPVLADEGMWLYNDPPQEELQAKYGFTLTDQWLDHLRLSSVRFNNGGSGSFVSDTGLVLTNHHVGADAIAKLSTAERDLITDGFLARERGEELATKDLELNVLYSIEDVTDRVTEVMKPDMSREEAEAAKRARLAEIEKESLEETGLRSDVVTLFRGGAYHLYRYKKYTDIRLVFAPEKEVAFFGSDTDNFEYPRFCLDVALFRVYEDGKPIQPEAFLTIDEMGLDEGDLTFVSGHPGRTERLNTVAHLEFLRDVRYPVATRFVRRVEVALRIFSERSAEARRRAEDDLTSYQNARKVYFGGLDGLQNPTLLESKRAHEESVRSKLAADPKLQDKYGDPYADVARALDLSRKMYLDHYLVADGRAFHTTLFGIAKTIHRYQTEVEKPNGERLREFRDSNLDSLKQRLFSSAPIYLDLEQAKLADSLSFLIEVRGADDPLVLAVMDGKAPTVRAAELIAGTNLADVEVRRKALTDKVQDSMLELAAIVDEESRRLRKVDEEEVQSVLADAYGRIAQLEHELGVTAGYPDATFTLRLAYGPVLGFQTEDGEVPAFTKMGGLFEKAERFDHIAPYTIPENWMQAKSRLDLDTPYNFIHTPDITGGNSGSPVVDRKGDLVGVIFDGNIESLVLDFEYEDKVARAVSVDIRSVVESLKNVYDAGFLLREMGVETEKRP